MGSVSNRYTSKLTRQRCETTGLFKCIETDCAYPAACPMGSTRVLPHCTGCQHGDYTGLTQLPGPFELAPLPTGRTYASSKLCA